MSLSLKEFYEKHGPTFDLEWLEGDLNGDLTGPHVERAGLSLAGHPFEERDQKMLLFGKMELDFLRDLSAGERAFRLEETLSSGAICVIISHHLSPPEELVAYCKKTKIDLFITALETGSLHSKLTRWLGDFFAPTTFVHGTFVEAYGMGVLIQGESGVGKSEAALKLIKNGHRLIGDDSIKLQAREGVGLMGFGRELNCHLLEIRGIGILNIAELFGAGAVQKKGEVDVVIQLEEWDQGRVYDLVGLEERFIELLGVSIPLYVQPVSPNRDAADLIETTVLNHRLREMGRHAAKEFNQKLLREIARKEKVGHKS